MKYRSVLPFVALLGCTAGSKGEPQCKVGADCASGACGVDGKCVAVQPPDASASDGSTSEDAAPQHDDGGTEGGGDASTTSGCVPNKDGLIDRSEVIIVPGLHAKFRVGTNATWNTAGTTLQDGSRTWDLSQALSNDKDVEMDTLSIMGAWYEPQFSGASYVAALSASSDLLGIFQSTSQAISLLGAASPADGAQKTEVTYSPSVPTLQFPLEINSSWSVNSQVNGTYLGVPTVYSESYTFKVDAKGDLKTPFGSLAVQRIAVVLTKTVGVVPIVTRTYVFVAECFGPIATVVSQSNEAAAEFSNIAEARRLAP
jgi:hypothetical protein